MLIQVESWRSVRRTDGYVRCIIMNRRAVNAFGQKRGGLSAL